MSLRTDERSPFTLGASDRERLSVRLDLALQRARRSGQATLATITCSLPDDVDPSAVACASRRAGEPWFVFEQPDRHGAALAGLGQVVCLDDSDPAHPDRFTVVADRWRSLSARAVADSPGDPEGGGPVAVGGFALAPDGGSSPAWRGFEPASLVVPEVALVREQRHGKRRVRITLAALAQPDDTSEELLRRLSARVEELSDPPLPLLDPAPTGRFQVSSGMPPEHYEAAVSRAVETIRAGRLQKIVLAREVQVHAPSEYDPAAVFGVLRDGLVIQGVNADYLDFYLGLAILIAMVINVYVGRVRRGAGVG